MNIIVDKKPECLATFTADIPADSVEKERSDIMQAYAKQAKIPGFRPGKAPAKVIAKRYAKEIDQELEQRLVRSATESAVQQESLKAIEVKRPDSFNFNDDGSLSMKADIILAPEFTLPEYKGIEIKVESEDVTDTDLENAITQLRERHAEYKDIDDRPLGEGDIAVITYSSTLDGKPVEEAIGKSAGHIGGREDFWIKNQKDAFLPGFSEAITGMNSGETREVTIKMPEDFPLEDLREKDVVFAVSLDIIKEQQLPELNDEFAAKLAEGKTLDEVTEMVRENIVQQKARHVGESKVQQVLSKLNEEIEFSLPQLLVDREAQGAANQMAANAMQQGMTEEQLKEQEEELLKQASQQARQTLKTNFIIQEIAQQEKIQVEQQDVLQRIMQLAQQENKKPEAFIKELQKNNQIPAIQNQVLIGKTIDFLVAEAKVEEIEAAPAEA